MGTLVYYILYWIWVIYYPVVNGRSDSERLGYPYSQEKMASKLELRIEFPKWQFIQNLKIPKSSVLFVL